MTWTVTSPSHRVDIVLKNKQARILFAERWVYWVTRRHGSFGSKVVRGHALRTTDLRRVFYRMRHSVQKRCNCERVGRHSDRIAKDI